MPTLYVDRHDDLSSEFGCCTLCGLGEYGPEHLLIWCPAVSDALAAFCSSARIINCLRLSNPCKDVALRVLRFAAHLCLVLKEPWDRFMSARWIARSAAGTATGCAPIVQGTTMAQEHDPSMEVWSWGLDTTCPIA